MDSLKNDLRFALRNLRRNPNDSDALVYLARTLAGEFFTDEAMELYWRAFDLARERPAVPIPSI